MLEKILQIVFIVVAILTIVLAGLYFILGIYLGGQFIVLCFIGAISGSALQFRKNSRKGSPSERKR